MNDNNQNTTRVAKNPTNNAKVQDLLQECEQMTTPPMPIAAAELQEVYQNALLGKQAVENLRPISKDRGFRNLLLKQYKEYSAIAKEIETYADSYGVQLNNINIVNRSMMYLSSVFGTVGDKSNSKLAQMMIQGINMGIISITKLINKKEEEQENVDFAEKMLQLLQDNLEEMKLFL